MNVGTATWHVFRAALVGAALAVSGCSSSSAGPSPFNGSWSCTGTTTYTFTEPAKHAPITATDPGTSLIIQIDSGDTLTVLSPSTDAGRLGDAGTGCSLSYGTSGDMATLEPNQTCPITVVSGNTTYSIEVSYTTGSGTVSGSTLTFTGAASFSGTAKNGAVSVALAGTVTGSHMCTD